MDNLLEKFFPFPTRDMLRFGRDAGLEIVVTSQVISSRNLVVRMATREGMSEFTHSNTGTGLAVTTRHKISDIPIFISVVDEASDTVQGEAFVTMSLAMNGEIVHQLASGYVYRQKGIAWPQSLNNEVIPARGGIMTKSTANPAAGAEITGAVPGGQMWRVIGCSFILVTDATAANRTVTIQFGGNVEDGFIAQSGVVQAASQTRFYNFTALGFQPSAAVGNNIMAPMPPEVYMVGSETFTTITANLQAGDNFGSMKLFVEQLYEKES